MALFTRTLKSHYRTLKTEAPLRVFNAMMAAVKFENKADVPSERLTARSRRAISGFATRAARRREQGRGCDGQGCGT
jgi:hypothetical protein